MKLLVNGRWYNSQLVRWCQEAKTWQPADEPDCNWDHSTVRYTFPGHRLRLRRMLVCEKCKQAYFAKESFERHECFSAY